jgi:hypothetical protein
MGRRDWAQESELGVAALPDGGHRVHGGLRRRMLETDPCRVLAGFIDAEAGGGAALVDHAPHARALAFGLPGCASAMRCAAMTSCGTTS